VYNFYRAMQTLDLPESSFSLAVIHNLIQTILYSILILVNTNHISHVPGAIFPNYEGQQSRKFCFWHVLWCCAPKGIIDVCLIVYQIIVSYSILKQLAGSMVNAVLLRLRAPDGSVSNSQLSPAQQIMCSEAVALSLSIGLPMDVDSEEEEEGAMIICGGKVEPSALKSENVNTSLLLLLSVSEGFAL
jgi:hypothetical protein